MLHPGIPFARPHAPRASRSRSATASGAGFRLDDEDLDGYVALDFAAFDEWYEEDERIVGHPRDPFHRVDVRRSSRPVRIEVDGEVVAETTRARLLYETRLPTRFYLPREDVRVELEPSERRSYCPYKGEASYWSVDAGGRRREDMAVELRGAAAGRRRVAGPGRLLGRARRRVRRRRAAAAAGRRDRRRAA